MMEQNHITRTNSLQDSTSQISMEDSIAYHKRGIHSATIKHKNMNAKVISPQPKMVLDASQHPVPMTRMISKCKTQTPESPADKGSQITIDDVHQTDSSVVDEDCSSEVNPFKVEDVQEVLADLAQRYIKEAHPHKKTRKKKKKWSERISGKKSRRKCDSGGRNSSKNQMGNGSGKNSDLAIIQGTTKPIIVQPAPPQKSVDHANVRQRQKVCDDPVFYYSKSVKSKSQTMSPTKLRTQSPPGGTNHAKSSNHLTSSLSGAIEIYGSKRSSTVTAPIVAASLDSTISTSRVSYRGSPRKSMDVDEVYGRVTKVYQSEKQSGVIHSLGASVPCAPPGTPSPDVMKRYEFIPSMNDIRSQRALKVRLEYYERQEKKKKEKLKEEKLKQEKINSKEQLKELKRFQRRQIYAINKIMTELENKNFKDFCKSIGIECKL